MKNLFKDVATKVKNEIEDVKHIYQSYKNMNKNRAVKKFFFVDERRDLFTTTCGVKVQVANNAIEQHLGVVGMPMAAYAPSTGEIVVNDMFITDLPKAYQDALIAHELGHRTHMHTVPKNYALEASLGYGEGLRIEIEADKYAYDQGEDILGALEWMFKNHFATPAMKFRIAKLKGYSK